MRPIAATRCVDITFFELSCKLTFIGSPITELTQDDSNRFARFRGGGRQRQVAGKAGLAFSSTPH
jgi:hypothetical protein